MTAKEAASGLPRVPEQCQGPNPDLTPPKFVAPPGTCDCAVHVVGPFAQFPLMSNRKVTPPKRRRRTTGASWQRCGLSVL